MNLAIVGYGKMGHIIERLAPEYGFEVKLRLDIDNNANFEGLTEANFRGIDAAVEFSTPRDGSGEHRAAGAAGRERGGGHNGLVRSSWSALRRPWSARQPALVWSPNFSVGVSVFSQLVAEAARLLARQPEYGAWAWEIHHVDEKRCALGHAARAGRNDEAERLRQADRRQQQPRRRASGHARDRLRFGGGHHHDPPHGAQPRRVRARRFARGALGSRQKRFLRFSRDRERTGE